MKAAAKPISALRGGPFPCHSCTDYHQLWSTALAVTNLQSGAQNYLWPLATIFRVVSYETSTDWAPRITHTHTQKKSRYPPEQDRKPKFFIENWQHQNQRQTCSSRIYQSKPKLYAPRHSAKLNSYARNLQCARWVIHWKLSLEIFWKYCLCSTWYRRLVEDLSRQIWERTT